METTTSGLRILVAEDTLSTAFTLRKMLEKLGHTVEVVLNGLAAVDVLCDFRPHVVILDIGMPGMDGYEVTRRIRLEPGYQAVPIMVVSSRGAADDIALAREAGVDQYLIKPIDSTQLAAALQVLAADRIHEPCWALVA